MKQYCSKISRADLQVVRWAGRHANHVLLMYRLHFSSSFRKRPVNWDGLFFSNRCGELVGGARAGLAWLFMSGGCPFSSIAFKSAGVPLPVMFFRRTPSDSRWLPVRAVRDVQVFQ